MSALPVSLIPILVAARSDGGGLGALGDVVCSVGEVVSSVGDVVCSRRSCKGLPVATLPPEVAAVSFPA